MQNRHQGRIHFSIQRTAAKCDWLKLPKLNAAHLLHLVCAEDA